MPRIIDYATLLERMTAGGFRSLYYNSGAFGFAPDSALHIRGWIGPADPTIRPAARAHVREAPEPWHETIPAWTTALWQAHLPGPAWLMPMSHWAYELDFGSHHWMPKLLMDLGLDPTALGARSTGDAIEFAPGELDSFTHAVATLLQHLEASDFMLAFPDRPILGTVHHHGQIWWQTTDPAMIRAVDRVAGTGDR